VCYAQAALLMAQCQHGGQHGVAPAVSSGVKGEQVTSAGGACVRLRCLNRLVRCASLLLPAARVCMFRAVGAAGSGKGGGCSNCCLRQHVCRCAVAGTARATANTISCQQA